MSKKTYYCTKCEARYADNLPRCPDCKAWNSSREGTPDTMSTNVVRMRDIDPECAVKIPTGMVELDAVLDGGTAPGQVILLAGSPGSGKSTLALEVADAMTRTGALQVDTGRQLKKKNKVLYVSTEEDVEKIRGRSLRIGKGENILLCHNKEMGPMEGDFAEYEPEFGIVDSVSRMAGADNEQGKLAILARIYEYAHATNMTTIVTAHVNSDNEIAGMIALQHTADTILQLDRDTLSTSVRTLRPLKNRYGSEDYTGLFEMRADGIHSFDPTRGLDAEHLRPGQAFAVAWLAGRSFPIEVQALTRRSLKPSLHVLGYPTERVKALLAIMGAHTRVPIAMRDVYVSILGGLQLKDAAIDAAIVMAIASSAYGVAGRVRTAFVGEVDLLGRIQLGPQASQRREVASRHGFEVMEAENLGELTAGFAAAKKTKTKKKGKRR